MFLIYSFFYFQGKTETIISCFDYKMFQFQTFSLLQANGIIQKLQGEVRGLVGKVKVKNTVTVSQEKVLRETQAKLQSVEKDLQSAQKEVLGKKEEVCSYPIPKSCFYCGYYVEKFSIYVSFSLIWNKNKL